jgi:hypothetical protein
MGPNADESSAEGCAFFGFDADVEAMPGFPCALDDLRTDY